MAYTRGETYIWSDGEHLHLWSETGMDNWRQIERFGENPAASGVQIAEPIVDELAVMRFAELVQLGEAKVTIERALARWSGNFGCAALEQLSAQLLDVSDKLKSHADDDRA